MISSCTRSALALGALVSILGAPRLAFAGDPAAAEALFNEARALVVRGDYEHACPKLEESQRLDAGMGTLFNLADCWEHTGKTASAWAAFREVAASAKAAGQTARETDARARAAVLEPKLVTIVVDVSPAASGSTSLVVKRDEITLGRAQWGSAIPIDPGKHVIVASAEGKRPWQTEVVVAEGARPVKVIVPGLENAPVAAAPAGLVTTEKQRDGSTQRTVGLIVGGVGVVGLGLGTFFGLRSIARHDEDQAHCDPNSACDATGVGLREDARDAGNLSTIAFIAGGALTAGGVVLYLTAPRAASTSRTSVGLGPGAITLKGSF